MDAVYNSFLSQPLCQDKAMCAPAAFRQPFPRRVRLTRRHMRSVIYHESSRTRPEEEKKCGVVCCCIVVLYVTWCVFTCCCVRVVSKPIKRSMGGIYKQPVHIVSYCSKLRKIRLLRDCVSIRKPSMWKRIPPGTPV